MDSVLAYLLLLAVVSFCMRATAGGTTIERTNFDLMDQRVLLKCRNENMDPVTRAVWTRDGVMVQNSSRITINDNGSITIAPARPEDEGVYRCGPSTDEESLGETFNFAVAPHAQKRSRQMFGHLGSNFSIPCPVEIGPISRQQGFSVDWRQETEGTTLINVGLIRYNGSDSEANTTLIPSSFDSSHVFNVSDLSLLVHNFSVPNVNKKIFYTCTISTGPQRQRRASAMINVTTQFTPIRIVTHLPSLIIAFPGENITETFVYEGAPVVGRSLSFAGENIAKSEKFIFEREFQSDNTTKISMEIPDPQEDGSGLLVIMLKGVNSTDMTESSIVIIPRMTSLMLTCGEPNLSFELPQQFLRTKVDLQLQIKVRFTEVPPFGTADDNSRVVNTTYEIEAPTTQDCPSDAERCTVNADLSERLPNDVAEFVRYRAEALLLVNGVEGRQFSPSTMTVQRDCDVPLEQKMLMLGVEFIDDLCSAVASERISEAVQKTIQDRCSFNCDDMEFGTPQLVCSADNRKGNFTVTLKAFEAEAVVEDFYRATQEPVSIQSGGVNIRIQCLSCISPEDSESNYMRYVIIGLVGVIVALILLVLGLIFVVVMKKKKKSFTCCSRRRKKDDPECPVNIELEPAPPVHTCIFVPDRPPQSPISLTLPAAIRSRTEQHHSHPPPDTPGIYVERVYSTTPPLQCGDPTLNVPDPPLSEHRRLPHPHLIDPSSQRPLQLHEVPATLTRELEGRYSPTSYQGSEGSSAYCGYLDNQNQTPRRSPMSTPPLSPRHATTVSAREVSPATCNCQCRHSPNPVRPAKPVPISPPHQSLSGNSADQLQPKTIFQFPCDNHCACACMQTRIIHSSTCQRCYSNPELHAAAVVGHVTEEQRATASSSQPLETTPSHQQGSQGLPTAVHQSPITHNKQTHNPLHCPSTTSLPIDENGYVLKTANPMSLSERRATVPASELNRETTGYIYLRHKLISLPSSVPSTLHTAAPAVTHSHERHGYVVCPMHSIRSNSSQPSFRPADPGYVERAVKMPQSICVPEDDIDGANSSVEEVPEDEAQRTVLRLGSNGTSDSEETEEGRSVEETAHNTGHVGSARTDESS